MLKLSKKEKKELLAVWFLVGLFVCMFLVISISDHFNFAINGAKLFSVDDNPFFNPEEISIEHRKEAIKSMQSLEDTWGNPNAFLDTNFEILKLPNLTNVGVLFAICIYCCFVMLWEYIGKKLLDRVEECAESV